MRKVFALIILLLSSIMVISQTEESILAMRNATTPFGKVVSKNRLVMNKETGELWKFTEQCNSTNATLTTWTDKVLVGGGGAADLVLDLDQPIKRTYSVGLTIPGNNLQDFVGFLYYALPTISCTISGTYPIEIGTETPITIQGSTTYNGDALTNGRVNTNGDTDPLEEPFGSGDEYTYTITYSPQQNGTGDYNETTAYSFQAFQDYVGPEGSGTIQSDIRYASCTYPWGYFVTATDPTTLTAGQFYSLMTKKVEVAGNKYVPFSGTGYAVYIMPTTWGDVTMSIIYDPNNLNATDAFTSIDRTYSSSGLEHEYAGVPIKVYYSKSVSIFNGTNYYFVR